MPVLFFSFLTVLLPVPAGWRGVNGVSVEKNPHFTCLTISGFHWTCHCPREALFLTALQSGLQNALRPCPFILKSCPKRSWQLFFLRCCWPSTVSFLIEFLQTLPGQGEHRRQCSPDGWPLELEGRYLEAGSVAQWVECWPCMHRACDSSPSIPRITDIGVCACDPSIPEVQARGQKLKVILSYTASLWLAWDSGVGVEVGEKRMRKKRRSRGG